MTTTEDSGPVSVFIDSTPAARPVVIDVETRPGTATSGVGELLDTIITN